MDFVFTVIFKKVGKCVASPTVLGNFGQEMRVEVPNKMRAVALAKPPDVSEGSFSSANFFLCQNGQWQLVQRDDGCVSEGNAIIPALHPGHAISFRGVPAHDRASSNVKNSPIATGKWPKRS